LYLCRTGPLKAFTIGRKIASPGFTVRTDDCIKKIQLGQGQRRGAAAKSAQ
jgi:hypothetical protein